MKYKGKPVYRIRASYGPPHFKVLTNPDGLYNHVTLNELTLETPADHEAIAILSPKPLPNFIQLISEEEATAGVSKHKSKAPYLKLVD